MRRTIVPVLFLAILAVVPPVWAASFTVDRTDDPDPTTANGCDDATPDDCSLRGAILKANTSVGVADVITLPASTAPYTLSILPDSAPDDNNDGDLDILDDLTINGATGVVIDGAHVDRVFHIDPVASPINVAINNLTVTNGSAAATIVPFPSPSSGGGIAIGGGTVSLDHVVLQGNKATDGVLGIIATGGACGGGLFVLSGTITMSDGVIAGNASGNGITDVIGPIGSTVGGGGGGVCVQGGSLTLNDSTVENNETGNGGSGSPTSIINSGAPGGSGGGILVLGGTVTLNRDTVSNNRTGNGGDGVPGTIIGFGGGGGAGGAGGGILVTGGTLTVRNTTAAFNTTGNGGIGGAGSAIGPGSTAGGPGGAGGAGGGLSVSLGSVTLNNASLIGNSTGDGAAGGPGGGSPTGAAGADGAGGAGGGVSQTGGTLNLGNTLVAGNAVSATVTPGTGPDCSGTVVSNGFNWVQDSSGCTGVTDGVNDDHADTDPLLDSGLQDNGGPTETVALLTGSPALDVGNDATCEVADQRGLSRPQGPHCDIGAFEKGACSDGFLEPEEECDDGGANSDTEADACRTDCTLAQCGDTVIDAGEDCDDGNSVDDDECSNACATPEAGTTGGETTGGGTSGEGTSGTTGDGADDSDSGGGCSLIR